MFPRNTGWFKHNTGWSKKHENLEKSAKNGHVKGQITSELTQDIKKICFKNIYGDSNTIQGDSVAIQGVPKISIC